MTKLILLLFAGSVCYAQKNYAPVVETLKTEFSRHKDTLDNCVNGRASTDKALGCLDAYKYIDNVCKVKLEYDFKKKYKKIRQEYFDVACAYHEKSENQLLRFFSMDSRACIKGYESIRDQILTIARNEEYFDEEFRHYSKKSSCKEMKRYVNLCSYVDGELRELLPESYQQLPELDFVTAVSTCNPPNENSDGLYSLSNDLLSLVKSPEEQVYEKLILNYRARLPAGKFSKNKTCTKVRTTYKNFSCSQFEDVREGEPIILSAEENREKRKRANDSGRRAGSGN